MTGARQFRADMSFRRHDQQKLSEEKEPGGQFHRAHTTVSVGSGYPWQVALQQSLRPFHQTHHNAEKSTISTAQIQNRPNAPTGSGRQQLKKNLPDTLKSPPESRKKTPIAQRNRSSVQPFTCRF